MLITINVLFAKISIALIAYQQMMQYVMTVILMHIGLILNAILIVLMDTLMMLKIAHYVMHTAHIAKELLLIVQHALPQRLIRPFMTV